MQDLWGPLRKQESLSLLVAGQIILNCLTLTIVSWSNLDSSPEKKEEATSHSHSRHMSAGLLVWMLRAVAGCKVQAVALIIKGALFLEFKFKIWLSLWCSADIRSFEAISKLLCGCCGWLDTRSQIMLCRAREQLDFCSLRTLSAQTYSQEAIWTTQ